MQEAVEGSNRDVAMCELGQIDRVELADCGISGWWMYADFREPLSIALDRTCRIVWGGGEGWMRAS